MARQVRSHRRIRAFGGGIILVAIGVLQFAMPSGIIAQENPLLPRLHEPALWAAHEPNAPSRPASLQVHAGRPQTFVAMAGASTLGSLVGAGAGILVGAATTESLVGVLFGYPGAWVGAAAGADLTGASLPRSLLASTVGLVAGAAVLSWGGETWGWTGFGVHGMVTALLAGGLEARGDVDRYCSDPCAGMWSGPLLRSYEAGSKPH